ncbi:hypothetical protein AVEN_12793-1 [Araneus ventricosus]|uniref:Uncharacterized protein n=1 Tax=Araneus ventricosus TaxID=182803 RepID=A0A4Y2ACX7_ARAVE|nr:hypothetical protein AVEN_12793-1 [Araneus ventricosus]
MLQKNRFLLPHTSFAAPGFAEDLCDLEPPVLLGGKVRSKSWYVTPQKHDVRCSAMDLLHLGAVVSKTGSVVSFISVVTNSWFS